MKAKAELAEPAASDRVRYQLDLQAEIVSRLTPYQIANGLANYVDPHTNKAFDPESPAFPWCPFARIAEQTFASLYVSRFYASLSGRQRSDLLAGHLRSESLSAPQMHLAMQATPLVGRDLAPSTLGLATEIPEAIGLDSTANALGRIRLADLRVIVVPRWLALVRRLLRHGWRSGPRRLLKDVVTVETGQAGKIA